MFQCKVCGTDLGWDRPSGVCSEDCLRSGQGFVSTWQPDIFGRGSRSVAEQPELFPDALGSKPKPVVVEPPDPDQLDLFAD